MRPVPRPQRDYVREIRPLLPDYAFAPRPRKLWAVAGHTLVLAAGIAIVRTTAHVWLFPLLALIMAHSLACLGFLIHDLSHNSVVRRQPFKYLLELYVWGLVVMSPHLWHRIHNQAHHRMPNSLRDPDRRYLRSESTAAIRWYDRLFVPSRRSGRINLTFLAFTAYITRNMMSVLLFGGERKPSIATFKPAYTALERVRIQCEIGFGVCLHVGIFYLAGATWSHYLWAGLLPAVGGSIVLSGYTVTNHLLDPFMEEPVDPLATTTSLQVPKLFDWMHHHFSHHTEHHLFPQMSSDYYPLVRAILHERYSDRFHCFTYRDAMQRLWRCEPYAVPLSPERAQS
ncbi:MAG: fatty acid desaturase [Betaproteobacteria bacterium]